MTVNEHGHDINFIKLQVETVFKQKIKTITYDSYASYKGVKWPKL